MSNIYIFKNGSKSVVKIDKMFGTHGPYMLEGNRLDQLIKVQLLHDASTSTSTQTGSTVSAAKTGNMVKRAVIGGALTGGVGAVVGGVTGKREATINTTTTTQIKTEITAELIYLDGSSQYIFLDDLKPFHWLLSFANQAPLTDEELEAEKFSADSIILAKQNEIEKKGLRNHLREQVTKTILPPTYIPEIVNKNLIRNTWFSFFGIILLSIVFQSFLILLLLVLLPFYKIIVTKICEINLPSDSNLKNEYFACIVDVVDQAISLGITDTQGNPERFQSGVKYHINQKRITKLKNN